MGSIGTPTDADEQKNKEFGLKQLKVLVTRSPEAHRKLMEQKPQPGSKGKRNLSLKKSSRTTGSANNEGSETRRARRCIDMTMDDDKDPEIKKEKSAEEVETPGEDTDIWFSTTARF